MKVTDSETNKQIDLESKEYSKQYNQHYWIVLWLNLYGQTTKSTFCLLTSPNNNLITYGLARSGLLLHSTTISQKSIGHSPTDGTVIKYELTVRDRIKHTSTNSISIRIAVVKNLNVCFTVPSSFSCCIAVGT